MPNKDSFSNPSQKHQTSHHKHTLSRAHRVFSPQAQWNPKVGTLVTPGCSHCEMPSPHQLFPTGCRCQSPRATWEVRSLRGYGLARSWQDGLLEPLKACQAPKQGGLRTRQARPTPAGLRPSSQCRSDKVSREAPPCPLKQIGWTQGVSLTNLS